MSACTRVRTCMYSCHLCPFCLCQRTMAKALRIEESQLAELKQIDKTSIELQQEGNYLEALEWMERALCVRQQLFGAESDQFWSACRVVGELCNLLAMSHLQTEQQLPLCLELLRKAEILTERDPPGQAITCNNLACFFRRLGKLQPALKYLQRALKIEARLEQVENEADTHLNACAVLSQLGQHQLALDHAQSALILLQEELFRGIDSTQDKNKKRVAFASETEDAAEVEAEEEVEDKTNRISLDRVAVLAISHHNIGVEQEFLARYEQSLISYKKGLDISERYLGSTHSITKSLKRSYRVAQKDIAARSPK